MASLFREIKMSSKADLTARWIGTAESLVWKRSFWRNTISSEKGESSGIVVKAVINSVIASAVGILEALSQITDSRYTPNHVGFLARTSLPRCSST